MEERGLSRGNNAQNSVTQAAESTKTFKDVVGVDEVCAFVCVYAYVEVCLDPRLLYEVFKKITEV